uniref:Uncharacterized protein n=1 Tax=Helianthus annuus TaxID=4232 RepID=A0A251V9I3_HELAN
MFMWSSGYNAECKNSTTSTRERIKRASEQGRMHLVSRGSLRYRLVGKFLTFLV